MRPAQANVYAPRTRLWLYDHETATVREVPIDLPELAPGDPPRTITIEALAGQRVVPQHQAPDGYQVRAHDRGNTGIVGDIFGMSRRDRAISVAKGGRVLSIPVPQPHEYGTPQFVGWVIDGGER